VTDWRPWPPAEPGWYLLRYAHAYRSGEPRHKEDGSHGYEVVQVRRAGECDAVQLNELLLDSLDVVSSIIRLLGCRKHFYTKGSRCL
jgi:hypothetical protein